MNNQNTPTPQPRGRLVRAFAASLTLAILGATGLHAQTASVTVNANSIVRDVPVGLMGVNSGTGRNAKLWTGHDPHVRNHFLAARMGTMRISTYPEDLSSPSSSITLAHLDNRVAQLLNAGATPVFFQAINDINRTHSDSRDAAVHAKYMDLNGNPYPSGSTVPTAQRIATNMAYLVNRYKSPPFNMTHQIWEVGNEPDINVNYQVEDSAEYIEKFQAVHNQLVASGLRGNVTLCGPVVSWDYGFGSFRDVLMRDFLDACKNQVDIVTRHIYGLIYSWESSNETPYTLLNASFETAHFNAAQSGSRGEGKLLSEMNARGVPTSVGTGVTEMNLFQNSGGPNFRHTITQGLWFTLSNHYSLYNPRSRLTTGFIYGGYNDQLAYHKTDKSRSFPYWAGYLHGALTGDQILAQTSSNSHIVVTASKDDHYLYVQVLNRHDTTAYNTTVTISNAPPVTAPTLHVLSATSTPDVAVSTSHGTTFTRSFAPMTVSVLRYPRTDAPTPPTPPAAPTDVLFDANFNSAPTGVQTYASGYTPVFTGGRLQLTSATTNARAAVILNGQPLPAAASRVQARFGFRVDDTGSSTRGEGFVFGAWSANPGAVGNSGTSLGYIGQPNRLWGVKLDNTPDEIAVVTPQADSVVEGWATHALAPYGNTNLYAVVDYDGPAGTVRARLYQGTSDAGTLLADITNALGNPAELPAGTVFGFTGATTGNTQITLIEGLRVTTESAAPPAGAPLTLNAWSAFTKTTNGSGQVISFTDSFSPDGIPVAFTFDTPLAGVDVTTPAAPVFTGATASYFGFEATGFGVGNSNTLGRFERGESFTLRATQGFSIDAINWREYSGDEQVHIRWTSGGVLQQQLFSVNASLQAISGLHADANTNVVITNVSPVGAGLSGRLRVNAIETTVGGSGGGGALTPGTSFEMKSWSATPWNNSGNTASFSGAITADGVTATFTFNTARTGVDVTTPAAPDFTGAVASTFGFESTGFGVGDTNLGRFTRGESFALGANHAFALQQINWREYTGDEVLHVRWTSGGVLQQQVFNINASAYAFAGIHADANTQVVITNVSPSGAHLSGRLRVEKITAALLQ